MTRRKGSGEVASTLALLALFAIGAWLVMAFAGNTPSPGPGLATRAVAESEGLGLWGKYVLATFVAIPLDVAIGMLIFGAVVWLIAAVAFGED